MSQEDIAKETIDAFTRLIKKGVATIQFEEETQKLLARTKDRKEKIKKRDHDSLKGKALEEWAENFLEAIDAGVKAGRLNESESYFSRVYPIEQVHNERIIDGSYDYRLNAINQKFDAIRKEHGLEDDEFWLIGEGPQEWEITNAEYDLITNELFVSTLIEFGAKDLADLLKNDPEEFEHRREAGRAVFFEPEEDYNDSLNRLRKQFLEESELCAQVEAYYAACTMLGATLETTMLALCCKNINEATSTINKLPPYLRPKSGSQPEKWTFAQLVHVANAAGWLPIFQIGEYELRTKDLIDLVRQMRNFVHPGKHIGSNSKTRVSEQDFLDAKAIYQIVKI